MKTSCRTMMVGFIGLCLGGCSVVVFEDSAACPAQKTCLNDAIKVAPSLEDTKPTGLEQDDTVQNSTSADGIASSESPQKGIAGQTASMSSVNLANQIEQLISVTELRTLIENGGFTKPQ